jgi:soluble P-type ATPase
MFYLLTYVVSCYSQYLFLVANDLRKLRFIKVHIYIESADSLMNFHRSAKQRKKKN